MTKVTMPEPVAWMHEEFDHTITDNNKRAASSTFSRYRYGLITTTQAEAYADAKVREALEEAASVLENNSDACRSLAVRVLLSSNADAIRALMPRTQP